MKATASYAMALALLAIAGYASADPRSDYYQRAATRDTDAFHALDVNHDGVVEQSEIVGDNDFGPRFNDMDRNHDGVVTEAELAVYIQEHYGIAMASAGKASMVTHHIAGNGKTPEQMAQAK
ncbi:MAG TPA: EF-hand domain-containing protein [Casimicrobiaceae bacterium]